MDRRPLKQSRRIRSPSEGIQKAMQSGCGMRARCAERVRDGHDFDASGKLPKAGKTNARDTVEERRFSAA
jgi:hypothetical protein